MEVAIEHVAELAQHCETHSVDEEQACGGDNTTPVSPVAKTPPTSPVQKTPLDDVSVMLFVLSSPIIISAWNYCELLQ